MQPEVQDWVNDAGLAGDYHLEQGAQQADQPTAQHQLDLRADSAKKCRSRSRRSGLLRGRDQALLDADPNDLVLCYLPFSRFRSQTPATAETKASL
ncbi:MAG: hypothetical protein JWP14_561 [Frankiales bacterium]|nr:hypothetical protein [Frankiales bacterium]